MRIVLDLQACQSTGSRHRGIGRYSMALAKAMLRNSGTHDIHLLLSNAFPETIEPIRREFASLVSPQNIHVWNLPLPVAELYPENAWRLHAAQIVREQMLASLRPDYVHITSLFEGSGDDAVSSIGLNGVHIPTAVTLYDLIPLVYEKQYLVDERQRAWYYRRLHQLKRADLLLAISESSRQEGIKYLQLEPEKVVNISSAVDECFQLPTANESQMAELKLRYHLNKPYVMYTGGIDLRKNIDGLIQAYAKLPASVRSAHQLAIVCSVRPEEKDRLRAFAKKAGLGDTDVIFTGFVPDEDLPLLYQGCKLFVFPSWHEGFGLPALEAMSCGVPVIAANTSSLPEVVGNADALFDPRSTSSITDKIHEVLTHPELAAELVEHGLTQAKLFSWDASAKRAISAMESSFAAQTASSTDKPIKIGRPKLAYISPLPPTESGIADYSAELVPALDEFYDLTLIVEETKVSDSWLAANMPIRDANWFKQHLNDFDRVVFHFGNSPAHAYMYELFECRPGIVVLHDFFLGDSLAYLDMNGMMPGIWTQALYGAHGMSALLKQKDPKNHPHLIQRLPCSPHYLAKAEGVIVHSEYSLGLAKKWMGASETQNWKLVPHLRKSPIVNEKSQARRKLGIADDEVLICSFGMLGANKQNIRLLDACLAGDWLQQNKIRLVFVGQNDGGEYGRALTQLIQKNDLRARVTITGFASQELYRDYLQAADLAVQLRTASRGESSGTIFDCLCYGLPLIANKNGSIAELPADVAILLDDEFETPQLQAAIHQLCDQVSLRTQLSNAARQYMSIDRSPRHIAQKYKEAIESICISESNAILQQSLRLLIKHASPANERDWLMTAGALASNRSQLESPCLYIDVTALANAAFSAAQRHSIAEVLAKFVNQTHTLRLEFVMHSEYGLHYARRWVAQFFDLLAPFGEDNRVEFHEGDLYFSLDPEVSWNALNAQGVTSYQVADLNCNDGDHPCLHRSERLISELKQLRETVNALRLAE